MFGPWEKMKMQWLSIFMSVVTNSIFNSFTELVSCLQQHPPTVMNKRVDFSTSVVVCVHSPLLWVVILVNSSPVWSHCHKTWLILMHSKLFSWLNYETRKIEKTKYSNMCLLLCNATPCPSSFAGFLELWRGGMSKWKAGFFSHTKNWTEMDRENIKTGVA